MIKKLYSVIPRNFRQKFNIEIVFNVIDSIGAYETGFDGSGSGSSSPRAEPENGE